MAKKIEPDLQKIGEYLKLENDITFVIPEYQRPYSWTISNCDKLWQDIVDFSNNQNDDRYFFGTIIINCQEDDSELHLIDGQQRTTTFLLLLKALLVRINDILSRSKPDADSEKLYRGLRARRESILKILYKAEAEDISSDPSDEDSKLYDKDLILTNRSIEEYYKNELENILKSENFDIAEGNAARIKYKQKDNKYTNYFRNYKFFNRKVSELNENDLNKIATTILTKCEVIRIKSWNVGQAIKMFNSLNSDGLPLRDSDIISAQLYGEAEKKGCQKEFKELREDFKNLVRELEMYGIANDNSLLMQYMYYIRVLNKETKSSSGAINVTTPGLRRYFTEENTQPISEPIKMSNDLIFLANVWKKISDYTLVKILSKFNENSKLFLASYFFRAQNTDGDIDYGDITEDKLTTILECMLRLFTILEIVDAGYSSRYFKSFLFEEEIKFVDSNISCDDIKRDFDNHIRANWKKDDIKGLLKDYSGNALVYLNEYLFAKNNKKDFRLGSKYDIEHIMPQSGSNLGMIRADAGISDAEEFKEFVNKLGNKILLEEKINRSIGNEWFRTKISTKLEDKTGYVDSVYPIASSLVETYKDVEKPCWTKDSIESATDKSINRIADFIFD